MSPVLSNRFRSQTQFYLSDSAVVGAAYEDHPIFAQSIAVSKRVEPETEDAKIVAGTHSASVTSQDYSER